MDKKEATLMEVKKLISILSTWGNTLVPGYDGNPHVFAKDKLQYCLDYLEKEEGMSREDVQEYLNNL